MSYRKEKVSKRESWELPDGMMDQWVDEFLPFRGECGICGGPDARHRIIDGAVGCIRGGDGLEQTAENYGLPSALLERCLAVSE